MRPGDGALRRTEDTIGGAEARGYSVLSGPGKGTRDMDMDMDMGVGMGMGGCPDWTSQQEAAGRSRGNFSSAASSSPQWAPHLLEYVPAQQLCGMTWKGRGSSGGQCEEVRGRACVLGKASSLGHQGPVLGFMEDQSGAPELSALLKVSSLPAASSAACATPALPSPRLWPKPAVKEEVQTGHCTDEAKEIFELPECVLLADVVQKDHGAEGATAARPQPSRAHRPWSAPQKPNIPCAVGNNTAAAPQPPLGRTSKRSNALNGLQRTTPRSHQGEPPAAVSSSVLKNPQTQSSAVSSGPLPMVAESASGPHQPSRQGLWRAGSPSSWNGFSQGEGSGRLGPSQRPDVGAEYTARGLAADALLRIARMGHPSWGTGGNGQDMTEEVALQPTRQEEGVQCGVQDVTPTDERFWRQLLEFLGQRLGPGIQDEPSGGPEGIQCPRHEDSPLLAGLLGQKSSDSGGSSDALPLPLGKRDWEGPPAAQDSAMQSSPCQSLEAVKGEVVRLIAGALGAELAAGVESPSRNFERQEQDLPSDVADSLLGVGELPSPSRLEALLQDLEPLLQSWEDEGSNPCLPECEQPMGGAATALPEAPTSPQNVLVQGCRLPAPVTYLPPPPLKLVPMSPSPPPPPPPIPPLFSYTGTLIPEPPPSVPPSPAAFEFLSSKGQLEVFEREFGTADGRALSTTVPTLWSRRERILRAAELGLNTDAILARPAAPRPPTLGVLQSKPELEWQRRPTLALDSMALLLPTVSCRAVRAKKLLAAVEKHLHSLDTQQAQGDPEVWAVVEEVLVPGKRKHRPLI